MSLKPMLLLGWDRISCRTIQRRTRGREFNPLDTRHLFDANTVWLGLKRGHFSVTMSGAFWNFVMQDCQLGYQAAGDGKQ